jgi:coenzyme F420-0:L-glutamate ligase/coenzyme F420-1:gamma-L-glutamate ligase
MQVLPVDGIGEVRPGDDLALAISARATWLEPGDVVVVTSKIVSKAEGRQRPAHDRERMIDAEAVRVVAQRGATRIVATRHGLVLAAAGVDNSNVELGQILLLPLDPDASARRLRAGLHGAVPGAAPVAVVLSDTMGRPWRDGLVDVAIGAAGVAPVEDFRGRTDAYGNPLAVTVTAVADEIAAAAELVKGKLAGVPVAVVRGLAHLVGVADGPGAAALVRPLSEDMFALGAAEAAAMGGRAVLDELARRSGNGLPADWTGDQIRQVTHAALQRYIAEASS